MNTRSNDVRRAKGKTMTVGCAPPPIRSPATCPSPLKGMKVDDLGAVVRAYKLNCRSRSQEELDSFASEIDLSAAIERAGLAQRPDFKRYSHQWRIPGAVLKEASKQLRRARLERARDFNELYGLVRRTIGSIFGIGELTTYDTALRIGARLGLEPRQVYLHAGTRRGARALGLDSRAATLSMSEIPQALRVLKPREVEDCLCIFKDSLSAPARRQRREATATSGQRRRRTQRAAGR